MGRNGGYDFYADENMTEFTGTETRYRPRFDIWGLRWWKKKYTHRIYVPLSNAIVVEAACSVFMHPDTYKLFESKERQRKENSANGKE